MSSAFCLEIAITGVNGTGLGQAQPPTDEGIIEAGKLKLFSIEAHLHNPIQNAVGDDVGSPDDQLGI